MDVPSAKVRSRATGKNITRNNYNDYRRKTMTLNELIAKLQLAAPKLGEKKVRYVIDLTGEMNIPHYDWDNLDKALNIVRTEDETNTRDNETED